MSNERCRLYLGYIIHWCIIGVPTGSGPTKRGKGGGVADTHTDKYTHKHSHKYQALALA